MKFFSYYHFHNASKECFWPKNFLNFMHRFKSAILTIFQFCQSIVFLPSKNLYRKCEFVQSGGPKLNIFFIAKRKQLIEHVCLLVFKNIAFSCCFQIQFLEPMHAFLFSRLMTESTFGLSSKSFHFISQFILYESYSLNFDK